MIQGTSRYNYYEILELKANAPQHEVTTAYERARHTYSGDNPAIYTIFSEQEAREFLTLIEEAYEILGNKTLRLIYDQRLRNGHSSLNDLTYASIIEASKQMMPEPKPKKEEPVFKRNEAFEKEILAREEWDGAFIQKVREYKNLSVQQISDTTKINPYYVGAVERMEPEGLPAVVFVRGYVVQIAKALGLDEKKVADSYMKIFKNQLGK
ncbi:helix-turn-helix domain-containing protein [Bdellovibrio sp. HCB2-146]|uniref:helix-turn-helix domain-containing protein n=1 Tax=Bdellovibrio sp. HCB2-146 TaxID=3394362 RepID=UPI0039BC6AD8